MEFKVGDKVTVKQEGWRLRYSAPKEVLTIQSLDGKDCCWLYSKKMDKVHHAYFNKLTLYHHKSLIGGKIL